MTTSELLSYDSLKSVLLHMEPNLRFKLSDQIPSLRSAEKATSLFVKNMTLASNHVAINDSVYKMEVVRQFRNCKNSETQQLVDELNKDEHGFATYPYDPCINAIDTRDWSVEQTMDPGDVKIEAEYEEERMNEEIQDTEWQLEQEKIIARRLEAVRFNRVHGQDDPNDEQRLRFEILGIEYSAFLKFTVESPSGTHVKYFEYNKKIPQAMKKLYEKVLGGRRFPIRVHNLSLEGDGDILRLPEHLKLKIRQITIGSNIPGIYDPICPLIHEESFPLRRTIIDADQIFGETKNYKHPLIQSSKCLDIVSYSQEIVWLKMLLEFSARTIFLDCKKFPKTDFITLIDNWLENEKEVGNYLSLGIVDENDVEELLKSVMERPNSIIEEIKGNGCTKFPSVITIPMKNNSELCVHCYEITDEEELEDYARWQLGFEVITAQHRHLWNVLYDDDVFN